MHGVIKRDCQRGFRWRSPVLNPVFRPIGSSEEMLLACSESS